MFCLKPATTAALALALGLSAACVTTTAVVDDGSSAEPMVPEGDLGLLVEDLMYGTPEERLRAVEDIAGLGADGAPATEFLVGVLESDLPAVRAEVARALPQVGAEWRLAGPALSEALADEDDAVVEAVAEGLAHFGERAVDTLVNALGDDRAVVRTSAARALGTIGTSAVGATQTLLQLMAAEDAEVRSMAARTLGQVATETTESVQTLVRALDDEDENVRANAAWSIGEHGSKARWAVLPLVDALKDGAAMVRMNAAMALGKMGSHASQATMDLHSVLEQEPDEFVRRECSEALRLINGEGEAVE